MNLSKVQLFHIATMIVGGVMATLTIVFMVGTALYIIHAAFTHP